MNPLPLVAVAQALDPVALLAYLALAAATGVLAYRRPAYAVAALIATAPFAFYRDVFGVTLTLDKVAVVAALAGLGARAAAGKLELGGARVALPIALALAALVFTTGISFAQAAYPDAVVRETFKAAQYLGLAAAAFAAWRNDPDERPVRYALLATIAAVTLAALAEELHGAPSVLLAGSDLIPRIAGPLEGPNQLAGFLGLALPLALAFALSRAALPAELVAAGVGFDALLLTLSRGGIAAAVAGIAIAIAGSPGARRRRLLPAAGVALGLGLAFLAVGTHAHGAGALLRHMLSASESAQPGGVGRRSDLWRAAWLIWTAHPWLGIGAGNFEYAVGSIVPGVRTHANNAYLQALVEGGIPLAAATAAALLAPLVLFAKRARGNALILGAFASCTAFALHQTVDDLLFFPKVGALYWIVVGLAAAESARMESAQAPARPSA